MKARRHKESGQALMLMVGIMTIVATSVAMYGLEYARVARKETIEFKRTTDVIGTLNATARYLQQLYFSEANCDPYVFNIRLNLIANRVYRSPFRQQHLVDEGAGTLSFDVSIGRITPEPPSVQTYAAPIGRGAVPIVPLYTVAGLGPQDATVTYWVTPYGQLGDHGITKYEQTVTLINICVPTTSAVPLAGPGFGSITNAATFSSSVETETGGSFAANGYCAGNSPRGSVDSVSATNPNATTRLDPNDRTVMMNYIRAGVITGSAVNALCSDLNRDGIFNEIDLNIMEKTLKGYLFFHVPSFQQ